MANSNRTRWEDDPDDPADVPSSSEEEDNSEEEDDNSEEGEQWGVGAEALFESPPRPREVELQEQEWREAQEVVYTRREERLGSYSSYSTRRTRSATLRLEPEPELEEEEGDDEDADEEETHPVGLESIEEEGEEEEFSIYPPVVTIPSSPDDDDDGDEEEFTLRGHEIESEAIRISDDEGEEGVGSYEGAMNRGFPRWMKRRRGDAEDEDEDEDDEVMLDFSRGPAATEEEEEEEWGVGAEALFISPPIEPSTGHPPQHPATSPTAPRQQPPKRRRANSDSADDAVKEPFTRATIHHATHGTHPRVPFKPPPPEPPLPPPAQPPLMPRTAREEAQLARWQLAADARRVVLQAAWEARRAQRNLTKAQRDAKRAADKVERDKTLPQRRAKRKAAQEKRRAAEKEKRRKLGSHDTLRRAHQAKLRADFLAARVLRRGARKGKGGVEGVDTPPGGTPPDASSAEPSPSPPASPTPPDTPTGYSSTEPGSPEPGLEVPPRRKPLRGEIPAPTKVRFRHCVHRPSGNEDNPSIAWEVFSVDLEILQLFPFFRRPENEAQLEACLEHNGDAWEREFARLLEDTNKAENGPQRKVNTILGEVTLQVRPMQPEYVAVKMPDGFAAPETMLLFRELSRMAEHERGGQQGVGEQRGGGRAAVPSVEVERTLLRNIQQIYVLDQLDTASLHAVPTNPPNAKVHVQYFYRLLRAIQETLSVPPKNDRDWETTRHLRIKALHMACTSTCLPLRRLATYTLSDLFAAYLPLFATPRGFLYSADRLLTHTPDLLLLLAMRYSAGSAVADEVLGLTTPWRRRIGAGFARIRDDYLNQDRGYYHRGETPQERVWINLPHAPWHQWPPLAGRERAVATTTERMKELMKQLEEQQVHEEKTERAAVVARGEVRRYTREAVATELKRAVALLREERYRKYVEYAKGGLYGPVSMEVWEKAEGNRMEDWVREKEEREQQERRVKEEGEVKEEVGMWSKKVWGPFRVKREWTEGWEAPALRKEWEEWVAEDPARGEVTEKEYLKMKLEQQKGSLWWWGGSRKYGRGLSVARLQSVKDE